MARRQGRTRRAFVDRVVRDVADGALALGELDVARLCRQRRLPQPTRQAVRQGPRGRIYLDVAWEDHGLRLEPDAFLDQVALALVVGARCRAA